MLDQIDIANVLFLDIETVSGTAHFSELGASMQGLWKGKSKFILKKSLEEINEEDLETSYSDRAGIYAEFGKIVCISVGIVVRDKDKKFKLRLKSFANKDENVLLMEFSELLNQYYSSVNNQYICGHNIKEFDIPFICRRMVIHQIPLPAMFQLYDKKPWETKHLLDTMNMWKFGDYKNYTSLKLLAEVLGFPSPKDDIDGSEVGGVFWEEDDLERIAIYCEKDVLATVQLFLRFSYMPLLEPEQVVFIDRKGTNEE